MLQARLPDNPFTEGVSPMFLSLHQNHHHQGYTHRALNRLLGLTYGWNFYPSHTHLKGHALTLRRQGDNNFHPFFFFFLFTDKLSCMCWKIFLKPMVVGVFFLKHNLLLNNKDVLLSSVANVSVCVLKTGVTWLWPEDRSPTPVGKSTTASGKKARQPYFSVLNKVCTNIINLKRFHLYLLYCTSSSYSWCLSEASSCQLSAEWTGMVTPWQVWKMYSLLRLLHKVCI